MADKRWNMVSPFDAGYTDPLQDPVLASQWGLMNPLSEMSMPPLPSLPQGTGNTALNLVGILGGLGLGLARPRVAPQALQNLQAANMMEWRDTQRELSEQRLALQKQDQALQLQTLAEMQRGEGGQPQAASSFAQPRPTAPPQPPPVSAVPHFALGSSSLPGAPMQFTPEARLAEPPTQPFFTGQPAPIRGNTSNTLNAFGRSQTRSTSRGTEREQATNNAVNDLTTAWMQNPDQAQRDPRRLLKEVLTRNPAADSKEVRQSLSNTLFETYHTATLTNQPGLDPKSAFRQAYADAAKDLGAGLFMPTDQMRTLATQVAGEGEHRGLAIGKDDKDRLGQLNIYEGNQAASVQGAKNAADIYTKGMSPSDLQSFETPPPIGSTMGDVMRGQARQQRQPSVTGQMGPTPGTPMSKQRQVQVETSEREHSQTRVAVESVAPTIANIVRKAEDIRKAFSDNSLQDWFHKGTNWIDVMQSQVTGFPTTEMGKLIQSYDTLVDTNGTLMARVVQGQKGNLTEQERIIGQRGFPATFRELMNNPVAGNDRLAVLSDVIALELNDPTFRLGRLDAPMSEFEKGVEAYRQNRIATRPELYYNPPRLPGAALPGPPPAAPPTMSAPMMTPEDQAISDRIQQELQQNIKPRKKP